MSQEEYPHQLTSDTHVVDLVIDGWDEPLPVLFAGPRRDGVCVFEVPAELLGRVRAVRMHDLTKPDKALVDLFRDPGEGVSGSLLPCPCCGSKAEHFRVNGGIDSGARFVECTNPSCRLSTALVFSGGEDAYEVLRERWNRRVTKSS